MSFSASRLTCFAIISAIEEDLRTAVELHVHEADLTAALPPDRLQRAQARREKDNKSRAGKLSEVLPYLDFSDTYEILMSRKRELPPRTSEAVSGIGPQSQRLSVIRNRVAHSRPMEIDDLPQLLDTANSLTSQCSETFAVLSETLARLRLDPSSALNLTISLPTDPETGPSHNLPVPDYDETGFFGRKKERRTIASRVKGAYPVISIIGDGGIGKTALAHRVAYDLLDDPEKPFDSIVWVTAKDTMLTTHEFRRINGAVTTSLGLLAEAAQELAGPTVDVEEPMEELLDYLETFKILLVLDNLETVLDDNLRNFLSELPMGSKVMITSRIGLGALDNPIKLEPLDEDDSTRLIYNLARNRGLRAITGMPHEAVARYAQQMNGHPLYIRWFIGGVQSGKRPEELVRNNELLLEFCMSNVYEYLGESARLVLHSMQSLPGARNQAEWAFLNRFKANQIQSALLELMTTNFVVMTSQSAGSPTESKYALTDFSRSFLDNVHPIDTDEYSGFRERQRELAEEHQQFSVEQSSDPFADSTIFLRNKGDVQCARLLRNALDAVSTDSIRALEECRQAQLLAPTYFEAWRIEAQVHMVNDDWARARNAFDQAIQLAPDSATTLYHYGVFLIDYLQQPEDGLRTLQKSAVLRPDSSHIAAQIAWAHHQLGDFRSSFAAAKHAYDLAVNGPMAESAICFALRSAAEECGVLLDYEEGDSAAELLEEALELTEGASPLALESCADRIVQLSTVSRRLVLEASGYSKMKGSEFRQRFDEISRRIDPSQMDRMVGKVKHLRAEDGYGFVRSGETDYFFHVRDLEDPSQFDDLFVGVETTFSPYETKKGERAGQLRILP